jgi:hypothetical protein
MAENSDQNVDGAGKVPAGDPVKTTDITERSDKRMDMLSKMYIHDAERYKSDAGKPEKGNSSVTPQSSEPKKSAEVKPGADQVVTLAPVVKSEEAPKPPEKKVEESPKKEPAKKLNADDLEKERRAQQARADKAEADLKKVQDDSTAWQTERTELLKSKELVDQFNSDPVKFVNERLPELGKKLAVAGDPVKMIELEVEQYHADLLAKFKKDLGEDWQPSVSESMRPGTPSYRFQLAINARQNEAMQKASEYVTSQRRMQEDAQRRINLDKEELKTEYGFTDEQFKEADAVLQKEGITYKNLVKLALLDKIIQQKIAALPPVNEPSPDIAKTRGASSEQPGDDERPKLSKEGRRMLSRLPSGVSL